MAIGDRDKFAQPTGTMDNERLGEGGREGRREGEGAKMELELKIRMCRKEVLGRVSISFSMCLSAKQQ